MTVTYSTYYWKNTLLWESFASPLPQNSSTRSRNNEIPTTCHHYPTPCWCCVLPPWFPDHPNQDSRLRSPSLWQAIKQTALLLVQLGLTWWRQSLKARGGLWKCCCMLFLSFIRNWARRKPLPESTHWILAFVVGCCRQKKTKGLSWIASTKIWVATEPRTGRKIMLKIL